MKTSNRVILATALAFVLVVQSGCAIRPNGFSQFYQDRAGAGITNLLPYSGNTKISTVSNWTNDVKELNRNSYDVIGQSDFQSPQQADDALMFQAKKVGADVVLISSRFLGSEQASVPVIQYNPGQNSTTTSSGTVTANASGSGGFASGTGYYYGTSRTTSPGTFSTEYVPVTVHRYQYDAVFFRKMRPLILGTLNMALPTEIRQKLERNTGVFVSVVFNGSPAFNANILEGDVVLKINGEDVLSPADLREHLGKFAGQKADLEIWRNGQSKNISVQLNNMP
jgi:hypothetical protein